MLACPSKILFKQHGPGIFEGQASRRVSNECNFKIHKCRQISFKVSQYTQTLGKSEAHAVLSCSLQ
jgi:hypothetical protein